MSSKMKVLIADDARSMREVLRAMVRNVTRDQVEVAEVEDGAEAVGRCRRSSFDLVFLDHNMPKMSGIDAAKEIRALEPPPYVVMVTAEHDRAHVTAALQAGVNDFLAKPIAQEGVERALRRYLNAFRSMPA